MAHRPSPRQRCAELIAAQNEALGWGLSAAEQQRYVGRLTALMPHDDVSCDELRMLCLRYHFDHQLVESLQDQQHPRHEMHMRGWLLQAVRILHHAGLDWMDDGAVECDDLAQIAWAELSRALPSFQYASRFSTWAHQVVIRSVQRHLRDSRAKKRAGRPLSLDQTPDPPVPISERDHPEAQADASVLRALVDDVLCRHPDRRLALIFKLRQDDDQSIAKIGRHVRLSPQRVRALLTLIYELLRNDPSLRAWLADEDDQPGEMH